MTDFNFYSPTEFVFGRDRDNEVENQGLEKGRTGGFVSLSANDISEIYKIAAKASI